jgi:hypothetical protein
VKVRDVEAGKVIPIDGDKAARLSIPAHAIFLGMPLMKQRVSECERPPVE